MTVRLNLFPDLVIFSLATLWSALSMAYFTPSKDHWESSSYPCNETMFPEKSPVEPWTFLICLSLFCFGFSLCCSLFVIVFRLNWSDVRYFWDTGVFGLVPFMNTDWLCSSHIQEQPNTNNHPEQQRYFWWKWAIARTVSQYLGDVGRFVFGYSLKHQAVK